MDPTEDLLQSLPESLQQSKLSSKFSQPDQKPSLIVVASLIDKAPNQGGLARTCEIMGAALVLPSLSCAQDREFRALSMSAEMWIPMCEVSSFQWTVLMFGIVCQIYYILLATTYMTSILGQAPSTLSVSCRYEVCRIYISGCRADSWKCSFE